MINLYKEMKNIVEDTTKSYKSDFYEHDVKNILNGGPQIYLWLPYYAGTCLLQSIDKSFQQIKEFKKGKRQLKSLEKSKRLWNKWIKE